jgi:tetratricopeptide (TPR) repeat protein
MEYLEFSGLITEANSHLSAGRLKEAEKLIYGLIIRDISDLDKASLCVKMAFIYDRLGNSEEALAWYEKGSAYEQIYSRFEITEKKAEYLAMLGMSKDAIEIYELLMKQPFLTEEDRNRIKRAAQVLVRKQMQAWR